MKKNFFDAYDEVFSSNDNTEAKDVSISNNSKHMEEPEVDKELEEPEDEEPEDETEGTE